MLGASRRGDGCWLGANVTVTWCIGRPAGNRGRPDAYDARYKRWNPADLPIVPEKWKMLVKSKTASQFKAVKRLLGECTGAGDRHRRRPRGRDDRPRNPRSLPLSRADPAPVAVGAGRRLDPQGAQGTQARQRDLPPLPRRAGPLARRLADRHEHEPAVHPARPPVRLPGRALGGPRADTDPASGGGSRPQHRRLRAGAVLGHRRAAAGGWHPLHRAVARPGGCLRRAGPLPEGPNWPGTPPRRCAAPAARGWSN